MRKCPQIIDTINSKFVKTFQISWTLFYIMIHFYPNIFKNTLHHCIKCILFCAMFYKIYQSLLNNVGGGDGDYSGMVSQRDASSHPPIILNLSGCYEKGFFLKRCELFIQCKIWQK